MSKLAGVANQWWQNPSIRSRLNQYGGIDGLVVKREGLALAAKDRWHALINKEVLEPIFAAMFRDRLIKTPSMDPIAVQVQVLDLLWQNETTKGEKIPIDEKNLPSIPEEKELKYHLAVASIKGLVLFARKHRLRPHTPRDTGSKKWWACFFSRKASLSWAQGSCLNVGYVMALLGEVLLEYMVQRQNRHATLYGGFHTWGYPQIINFDGIFPL